MPVDEKFLDRGVSSYQRGTNQGSPPPLRSSLEADAIAGPPQGRSKRAGLVELSEQRLLELLAHSPEVAGWKTRVRLPLEWGVQTGDWIYPGAFFASPDGGRRVLMCGDYSVVFIVGDRVFGQSLEAFQRDLTTDPVIVAALQAKGMVLLSKIVIGAIMAGTASTGWAAYFIVSLGQFGSLATEAREDPKIQRLVRWGAVFLSARTALRRCAPTLYDKLFYAVVGKAAGNLPAAISPGDLANMLTSLVVGVIVKRPQGFFQIGLTATKSVAEAFVIVLKAVPSALKLTEERYRDAGAKLIVDLVAWGVDLSPGEAQQIRDEIKAAPECIFDALRHLQRESVLLESEGSQ